MTDVEHIGVAYGTGATRAGVRPAIVLARENGKIRVFEWNASRRRFSEPRWIEEHKVRPALPASDPRVSAMLGKFREAIARGLDYAIDELT